MISEEDVSLLTQIVTLLGLLIGLVLGWIAQFGRFCTLGAISDWHLVGDTSRLRMWGLAILTAIAGTQLLAGTGLINATDSFYVGPRIFWLSYILGGLLFGFGMALASGCGNRSLVRLGGGSLKALIVFLVMAVTAYITMRGLLGVLRVNTIERVFLDLGVQQDIPSLLGLLSGGAEDTVRTLFLGAVLLGGLLLIFSHRDFRQQPRYILTGLIVGLLVVAGWAATGYVGFIEEDPNTLEARYLATNTRSIESLTFVAPLAYSLELLMLWSDASLKVTFSIATVTGVIFGSLIYALSSGQFRWEGFQDRQDLTHHLIGAALMGTGGVLAFGCTIGQGISGLSLLGLGSLLAALSIVLGARLGLAYIERRSV